MVKVCIVGTGAVGGVLAVAALYGGCDVIAFSREESLVEVSSTYPLKVKTLKLGDLPIHCDYAVICTKAYDTQAVAEQIRLGTLRASVYVVAQNGIGGLEAIEASVPRRSVVAGAVVNFGCTRRGRLVELKGVGPVYLGCKGYDCSWSLYPLVSCLRLGGIEAVTVSDITPIRKKKVAINSIINSLTTLLGVPNGYIIRNDDLREIVEILALEASRTLELNFDEVIEEIFNVASLTSENISSMLQDLNNCRPLELDAILGPLAKESVLFLILKKLISATRRIRCEEGERA